MEKMLEEHGEHSFDLVDIDPMGCSARYFDNAIRLARLGLIVFVGDLQFFKRFKSHVPAHYFGMDQDDYSLNMVASWYVGRAKDLGVELCLNRTLLYPGNVAAKLYYRVIDEDDDILI